MIACSLCLLTIQLFFGSAEQRLKSSQTAAGHPLEVLKLVASSDASFDAVRQASSVHFKNLVKKGWDVNREEGNEGIIISAEDRFTIKNHLVQLMCTTPPQIQAQLSESISLIAAVDYPQNWDNLLGQLVQQMHSPDPNIVNGVLMTADTIFRSYRYEHRSDELYEKIRYTLQGMQAELLTLLKTTGQAVDAASNDVNMLKPRLETLRLACSIYYSLNYQDLPEFMEDHLVEFMALLTKYLNYQNPLVVDTDEELAPGPIDDLQTAIIKILYLYGSKDEESFIEHLPRVTSLVWNLLIGLTQFPKHDTLATTSIDFLTMLIERPMHRKLFQDEATLREIVAKIVIPNLTFRESDQERFEDDPREFIVTEVEGSDSKSRRRCSQKLLSGMCRQFETETTSICAEHVSSMLAEYAADPNNKWKAKDAAIHLMMGIAIKRESAQNGVTEVTAGVNVMDFFQNQILPELQDANHTSRPVVKSTSLKFVGIFRNQFSKEHLVQMIPLVIKHLHSPVVVVHSLAAHVLERIMVTKEYPEAMISPRKINSAELREYLDPLFTGLFAIVENVEQNENDYAMKCVMRALATAGQDVVPVTQHVIEKLTAVLSRVAKNPRNPQFNHYVFESIAVLIKNVCSQNPEATASFEQLLFEPFNDILRLDVAEFTPYVFQILAQLLEYRPERTGLGQAYTDLFPPLLKPFVWEMKGNVPALARLMQAYICKAAHELVSQLVPILGIFQKLLASKATETSAMGLLSSIITHFPRESLSTHINMIFELLLRRLQSGKTLRYTRLVTTFFALFIGKHGSQAFFDCVDRLQAGLGVMVLASIWIPRILTDPPSHRVEAKIMAVGLTKLLCDSPALLASEEGRQAWSGALRGAVIVLTSPALTVAKEDHDNSIHDQAEIGYDATFSRLTFATKTVEDPFVEVVDPRATFVQALHALLAAHKAQILPLIQHGLSDHPKLSSGLDLMFQQAGFSLS